MAELVETPQNEIKTPATLLAQSWGRLGVGQRLGLGVALAALIALVVGFWLWGSTPEYRVLYGNLSDKDGGAIIDALQQMNVPYKFAEGGGTLMVPAPQVHEVRLHLAEQGLPKGGTAGFELMENQKFGTSEFLEQVNYMRALEGELARSVQTLSAVQSARVHLAIPKATVFVKEQPQPTASVVLTLYSGRTLDPGQVNAVVHLISSSIPNLTPQNVAVVDQSGTLLSAPADSRNLGLDSSQIKYVHQIEDDYSKRIEDILSPLMGSANIHARVTADIDFTQTEQTAETYHPNQPPNQAAVVSQQTLESNSTNANSAGGVPGALTNQPPVPATAPFTAPGAAPPAPSANGASGNGAPGQPSNGAAPATPSTVTSVSSTPSSVSNHKETTTNFDVDRTISHARLAAGSIRRLSVAVVLNNRTITDSKGKTTIRPLTEAEKTQMSGLIKEAVGFDDHRGDSLSLLNSPFIVVNNDQPDLPLWKQPESQALAKDGLKYLTILGLGLLLILGVIRPAVRNFNRALEPEKRADLDLLDAEGGQGNLSEMEAMADENGVVTEISSRQSVSPYEMNLKLARQIALEEPSIAASVVRDWVIGNE